MKNKQFNIIVDSKYPILLNGKIYFTNTNYSLFLHNNVIIKYCKIENINDIEKFFYVMYHPDIIDDIKNYFNFPNDIKTAITNNKLKVVFFSFHESPPNIEIFVTTLINTIKFNNWNASQFYIINNNSLLDNVKEKFNTNINFFKINAVLRIVSSMLKPITSELDIIFDKKFIFLCLNRRPDNHRMAILTYLKNYKLFENDITDWSWITPPGKSFTKIQSIQHLKTYIPYNNKNLIKDYLEITKEKKLSFYEQNINWFDIDSESYKWSPEHHLLTTFQNSYINIITETAFLFEENDLAITEKSFKPFYYFQIPIFLARPGHVKALKEEYDLYLFDDLIDHSYDDEKDDAKRFHMIVNEIQRLSTMREEISNYYKNNVDKLIDNHNFIKTYSDKKIQENYFLNLIDGK